MAGPNIVDHALTGAELGSIALNFVPKAWSIARHAPWIGNTVGGVVNVVSSFREASSKQEQITMLANSLGFSPAKTLVWSDIANDYLENSVFLKNATNLGMSTGGSIMGGAVGTFLIPIPYVGTLAGATVGGMGGNYAHGIFYGEDHSANAIAHVTRIYEAVQSRQEITQADMFAAISSTLPEHSRERLSGLMKNLGNREADWEEFLAKYGDDMAVNGVVKKLLGSKYDEVPGKTALEKITNLTNAGLNPTWMIIKPSLMPSIYQQANIRNDGAEAEAPSVSQRTPPGKPRSTTPSVN